MQQIPKEGKFGFVPRDVFCASTSNTCLFSCDYSQNEVRILAHMANDQTMINLFCNKDGTDFYKQMSSAVTGKSVSDVSVQERAVAKQVTLAVVYGMGIQSAAKKLRITYDAAQKFFASFYKRFPEVRRWMDETKKFARNNGYVTTIVGRRRYLDDINSSDTGKRSQAERQAINTIIQGSAADLMKLAMLKMASRIVDWHKEGVNYGGTGIAPKLM